jgi:hypothetical protein
MSEPRGEVAHELKRPLTVLATVAGLALGLWVLGRVLDVLLLCFGGVLLGLFLHGAGAWLARKTGLSRLLAVGAFCASASKRWRATF